MTAMPGWSCSLLTSVMRPSLMPTCTAMGWGRPSCSTHTCLRAPGPGPLPPPAAPRRENDLGARGMICATMPPPPWAEAPASGAAAALTGVNRRAVLGTSSTSVRSVAVMVAAAVMPGRRLRSALSTCIQVV